MPHGDGTRTISLRIQGVFDAGAAKANAKGWLDEVRQYIAASNKEAVDAAKAETKAKEDEAKKQQKLADEAAKFQAKVDKESLEYAVRNAKQRTKDKESEEKRLEREVAESLKRVQKLHEQTDRAVEKSEKAVTDFKIKEAKRAVKEMASGGGGGMLGLPGAALGGGGGPKPPTGGDSDPFGSIFAGTFLGTLAGGGVFGAVNFALTKTLGIVTSLATGLKDLGVEAVQLAGDFEISVNAMQVFTGSTSAAKRELAEMDKLARDTPGLRMKDAEEGAVRLRALGFEAKTAQDFVVGLAKHKLLSGADEMALQRVIVNLTQLSTGSPRMSQDIKEMILSMPTLRNAMVETFGSIDKFKGELQRDPDGALKKFAAGLKNTETASAGLNDSIGKLFDSLIDAGRKFGEPILDPLTKDIKELTKFVYENQDTWTTWGQDVADAISGVSTAIRGLQSVSHFLGLDIPDKEAGPVRSVLRESGRDLLGEAIPLYGMYRSLKEQGEVERKKKEAEQSDKFWQNEQEYRKQLGMDNDTYGPVADESNLKDAIAEKQAADKKKFLDDLNQKERDRKRAVEFSSSYRDKDLQSLNDAFAAEEAKRDAHLRFTLQQELEYQTQVTNARRNNIQQQVILQQAYYDRQIQLADGDKDQIEKIEIERYKTLSSLQREYTENEYKSQKQSLELQKQISEQKRRAAIDLKGLQISGVSFGRDKQLFDINRQIEKEVGGAEDQFKKLVDITDSSYKEIERLTRESYAEQFKDQSLTAEQRVNLELKMQQDLQQLAELHRRALIEIDDRKTQKIIQNLERQRDEATDTYKFLSDRAGGFTGAFFSPETFGASALTRFRTNVLKQDQIGAARQQVELQEKKVQALQTFMDQPGAHDNKDIFGAWAQSFAAESKKLEELKKQFADLTKDIPRNYEEFASLADLISTRDVKAFDDLSAAILRHRQTLDKAELDSEIDYLSSRIDIENGRAEKDEFAINELTRQKTTALRKREKLDLDQLTESTNQYANSLAGLNERLINLHSDDKTQAATLYTVRQQILKEQITLVEENISLEERLGRVGEDAADRYRNAWLKATYDVRDAQIKAVEEIIASNVRLDDATVYHPEQAKAKILKRLEQEKTQTDVIADLYINAFDRIGNSIDKAFDKMSIGKIPVLGDFAKAQARVNVTQMFRGVIDHAFPDGPLKDSLKSTGNPLLDESQKQTDLLKDIRDNTGGKSAGLPGIPGVTLPNVTNNAGGSFLTMIFHKIFGGNIFNKGGDRSQTPLGGPDPDNPYILHFGGDDRMSQVITADPSIKLLQTIAYNTSYLASNLPENKMVSASWNSAFSTNGSNILSSVLQQASFSNNVMNGVENILNNGIGDLVFPEAMKNGAVQTTNNPILDEVRKQTRLLEKISKTLGVFPSAISPTSGSGKGLASLFSIVTGRQPTSGGTGGGWNNDYAKLWGASTSSNDPTSGGGTGSGGSGLKISPEVIREITEGKKGSIFGQFKSIFGPRRNFLKKAGTPGSMSKLGGMMGGAGDIMAMAGGMIGGRTGNVLSMAGTGMSIGSMFGPWGAAIGAGIGALIGLFKGKDNAIQKLKEAASSEFGISVKDKKVLESLKNLGEGMFGRGKVGQNAVAVVRSEDGMNILRSYAESSGQSGLKIDRLNMGDPNWKGNDFRSAFGGFREKGGEVRAGKAYIVGEKRAELFVPHVNGTILPAVPKVTTTFSNSESVTSLLKDKKRTVKKIKEAVLSDFGITIKDNRALKSYRDLTRNLVSKERIDSQTLTQSRSKDVNNIVRILSEQFGQQRSIERSTSLKRTPLAGFREKGGSVVAGYTYMMNERGPEAYTIPRNGEVISNDVLKAAASGGSGSRDSTTDKQMMRLMQGMMATMDRVHTVLDSLDAVPPDHIVAKGARGASQHIADAYEYEVDNDGNRTRSLARKTGW